MTELLVLKEDNCRCYAHVGDILTVFALSLAGAKVIFAAEQKVRFGCRALGIDLVAMLDGFDSTLSTGSLPPFIALLGEPKKQAPDTAQKIPGVESVFGRIIAAIFATFAAQANDWVRANISTDYANWPPVSNFARVVRNAIVHGGTINIQSPAAPTVSWCGVDFNHTDFGTEVISEGHLSLGDLIALMLDLDAELSDLSAPLSI
jgi:hypothetical protein